MNLTAQIKELELQILAEEQKCKRKIQDKKDDLATLRRLNDACEKCNGTGKRHVRSNGYGNEFVDVPCNMCEGTGKINKTKDDE